MPSIASILKDEILRLARKEVRSEVEALKKASTRHRSEIAELKRRVGSLEKELSRAVRADSRKEPSTEPEEGDIKVRFSAKRLAAQRKKLGLSAAEMGALIGVSAQTIYNWETEKSRPRQAQLVSIAALRGMGKSQIKARLEALAGQEITEA